MTEREKRMYEAMMMAAMLQHSGRRSPPASTAELYEYYRELAAHARIAVEALAALWRCPMCGLATTTGATGYPVCDGCGWHGRPPRPDRPVTYGGPGGPMGGC
jgi:predicted RNA-binding Zn-ribbon protein involved in translation (DUF1610 family)